MGFESILSAVRKSFSPRKMVDFEEQGLHFELEPLKNMEEVKVIEACKGVDDSHYIEALKRNTLACSIKRITLKEIGEDGKESVSDIDLSKEFIEGDQKNSKTTFLFLVDYISQWPSSLTDLLFDVFSNMVREIESKVRKSAKFEVFMVSEKPPEEKEPKIKPVVEEEDDTIGLTETEKLGKKVEKELEDADEQLANAAEA